MGVVAADGAGISFNGAEVETAARKDAAVGLVHLVVGSNGAGFVDIEGVSILHDEFAAAHQPETGANLVAKLGLDLVKVQRHLPVGAHFAADDIGHHLFMGRPHAEFRFLAVLEAQQFLAVLFPASRFLPQFCRIRHRHEDLQGAGAIHLIPHNLLHLADRPQAEREIVVDPRGDFADQSGTEHELMADNFGIGRRFFEGRDKVLGIAHGNQTSKRGKIAAAEPVTEWEN